MLIPYDPAITLLGIYLRRMKTYVHTKIYAQMFTAALFITAKTQNKTTQMSFMSEFLNKVRYIHMLEHYLAIKRSKTVIHAITWMKSRELC